MQLAFLGNFDVDYTSESHHAASLEALGHTVARLQEGRTSGAAVLDASLGADALIWVHTHGWHTPHIESVLDDLRAEGIPTLTYHLDLWLGLQRQRDMLTDPYWKLDHFFTVDARMADWLTDRTPVRGHYTPAGVFEPECFRASTVDPFDVAFVGSRRYHPEWPYRPRLIDWLHNNYGERFQHHGGDGRGTVRGAALNQVYADARVVVGDSLCIGYDYPDYWSDRVYETLGRGGFLIHPRIEGMERHFTDGEHLVFYEYGAFDQLHDLIEYYLAHPDERERIAAAGHAHVKAHHTYRHRWTEILKEITA